MKKGFKKALVMLLSLAMVFTFMAMPTTVAFADDEVSAEVTFTMSNKGLLASAKDGTAVAEKPVTVTDLDKDGHLTYDEALVAAHNAYFEGGAEAGYALGSGQYGPYVSKLWGVDTSNTLFMTNDEGLPSGVTMDEVKAGDSLYVSINADDAYYADWYSKFSEKNIEATDADDITVTLTGHLGMAFTEEDMQFVPLEGVKIGLWKNGAFEAIEGAVTGADGKATFKLAAGEYILTAKGTVKDEITPWGASEAETVDCPIMAPYAKLTVKDTEPEPEAEKIPYDGEEVTFIKADGSGFGMYAPQEGTTIEYKDDSVVIHYVPKNTSTYAGFNWGSIEKTAYKDESVQPGIEVKPNADGSYDITLSKDYCGYAHPIAVVKNKFSKDSWTSAEQYYLAIPEPEVDKIPYDGEEVTFIKADGSGFGMFAPQEGTTIEYKDDSVVIHYVPKNTTTYAGFNWGSIEKRAYTDESVQPGIEVKANADGTYDITLSKDNCGYGLPVAVIKKTFGGRNDSWTSAEQYYLAIPEPAYELAGITRIYGQTRYQTAMLQADELKEVLGVEKFDNVIVATGTNFADALAGAYLGYVKKAPILLVRSDVVNDVTAYIKKNLAEGGTVYILGGEAVVPKTVETGLPGIKTKRLYGNDRYLTNIEILKEAGVTNEDIIVATGTNFADSLSASAAKLPILLVKGGLNDTQKAYLKTLQSKNFYLAGGEGVLPPALEKELKASGKVTRLGGKTRFETSVMIAEALFEKPEGAVVAYSQNYPDGLYGGPVAAYLNAPLVLVRDANADTAAAYTKKAGITKGLVLGGPALVSDKSVRSIFSMKDSDKIIEKK